MFNGEESRSRQTTTIHNSLQGLIQLFQCLEKAEEDGHLLTATLANKEAMDIDVGNLREYYETLMCNVISLFQQFTPSIQIQNTYTEAGFPQLVQICQTFGHND
jgi:signal-transduction protein with cAMP-binding, CBS, and nucleotidyltransferase domain